MAQKIYVLDTNVLLHDPNALFSFEDNEVVVPLPAIEELDALPAQPCSRRCVNRSVRGADGVRQAPLWSGDVGS